MKASRLLLLALLVLACNEDPRGVRPNTPLPFADLDRPFDPAASAGVFIGLQQYPDLSFTTVNFGVDDAIDLAHKFVVQCRTIPASRAAVAISGRARKERSKTRLQELRNAGVLVTSAEQTEVLRLLRRFERVDGLFVVTFAGHGFSKEGTPYLATASSRLDHPRTWLSSLEVADLVATRASRSLLLLDACRDRVQAGLRDSAVALPAAFMRKMAKTHGQVVLYAAPAGGWAYDDMVRKNGVFSAAVLDSLACDGNATTITVDNLASSVAKQVGEWVRRNKQPGAKSVIQMNVDDRAKRMPLVTCVPPRQQVPNPVDVAVEGTKAIYRDKAGLAIRTVDAGSRITHAVAADLDADLVNEVTVATGSRIIIFEADGKQRRTFDARMPVRRFDVEKLFFGDPTRQIVALCSDTKRLASRVAIVDRTGMMRAAYEHRGELRGMLISPDRHQAILQKIVVWTSDGVVMLDPKRLHKQMWTARLAKASRILDIDIGDHDDDKQYDLEVRVAHGRPTYLDFKGRTLEKQGPVLFQLIAAPR